RVLAALDGRTDAKGLRDRALLRLLFDLGLRRAEAVGLDVGDLDLEAGTADVLGKGRTQKVRLTLPGPTREALAAWLAVRGPPPGPLLTSCGRAGKGTGPPAGSAGGPHRRAPGAAAGWRGRGCTPSCGGWGPKPGWDRYARTGCGTRPSPRRWSGPTGTSAPCSGSAATATCAPCSATTTTANCDTKSLQMSGQELPSTAPPDPDQCPRRFLTPATAR